MKITIIGAGTMGSIYGEYLSLYNGVCLVDTNQSAMDQINGPGLRLLENGQDVVHHPTAMAPTERLGEMDLVILFAKALFSRAALGANRGIIGPDTYVLTLQNGSGHEDILSELADQERIVIDTTENNGAVLEVGYARHGGEGKTNVGMLMEDKNGMFPAVKASSGCYGFQVWIHKDIQELIWGKLMTSASLSAVTGILQVKMSYIAANLYVWNLTPQLVKETVTTAGGPGFTLDEEEVLEKVRTTSRNSPEGIIFICISIVAGGKTKVDAISGSVVRATRKNDVSAPIREIIVNIIHALEGKETETP